MAHQDIRIGGNLMLETTHRYHEKTTPTILVTEVAASPSSSSCRSNATTETHPNPTIISFLPNDPENPHNWSSRKKSFIIFTGTVLCTNSTMGSTLTSNMFPALRSAFSLPPQGPESVLAASVYLVGFMFGPLIFAPLSESHGRRPTLLVSFVLFTLSLLGTALAPPSWGVFLAWRFLTGTFGSPPVSVVGGVIADVFCDEGPRGRVMMLWSGATVVGPVAAPIVAGFVSPVGWKWTFWIALTVAVLSLLSVVLLPETLAAKILSVRAAKLNREAGSFKYATRADLNRGSTWQFLKLTLSRPVRLLCTEMLLGLTCVYVGFIYAIFYMLVKIFPDIFQGIYGLSPGLSGVAFSVLGLGAVFGCIAAYYDTIAPRLSEKYPAKKQEYLRLPLACAAAPFFAGSLLWLGWASRKDIHLMVPLASLLPHGFASQLIFVAMINYLADSYEIYSASALAACGATRSIAGALIPLAADAMVDRLGIARTCTVLAGVSAALGLVPVLFIVYGERIRAGSKFSAQIRAQREVGGGPGAAEGGVLGRSLSAV